MLCRSQQRIAKDRVIRIKQEGRLRAYIDKLTRRVSDGKLVKADKINQAIGRLQERYPRVARYFQVFVDIGGEFAHRDHAVLISIGPDSASSNTWMKALCCHFSSSRETWSAFEDVSTVTLPAANTDFSTSAAGSVFEGSQIRPAERQASSKTRSISLKATRVFKRCSIRRLCQT